MTTYQVTSEGDGHQLIASWPDLPGTGDHPVATFKELKLATAARNVLSAASRYRWHRWIQLHDQGFFTEERVGPGPGGPSDGPNTLRRVPQRHRRHPLVAQIADRRDPRRFADEWLPRRSNRVTDQRPGPARRAG